MSTGGFDTQGLPQRDSQALVSRAIWLISIVLLLYFLIPMVAPWFDDKAKALTSPANVTSEDTAKLVPENDFEAAVPDPVLDEKWDQAVEFARLAELTAKCDMARERVQRLNQLEANWKARSTTLLHGDPGRRIASSPAHVALALEVFEQERPSPHQLRQWERQAEAFRSPIASANLETSRSALVTAEYIRQLNDLGRSLEDAAAILEKQELQLSTLSHEAKLLTPGELTLEEALQELRAKEARELADRILTTRQEARANAEQRELARIAQRETELVAAEGERQAAAILREKERIEQLALDEAEKAVEEDRVREAEKRAELEMLKAEAEEIEEKRRLAQLEIEFERDRPSIERFLVAFTTPGYGHRQDGTKGPVSLGFLDANGCLQQTSHGMSNLAHYANSTSNDRPPGAIPGGIAHHELSAVERAQKLLIKYGELMVAKGMLAP